MGAAEEGGGGDIRPADAREGRGRAEGADGVAAAAEGRRLAEEEEGGGRQGQGQGEQGARGGGQRPGGCEERPYCGHQGLYKATREECRTVNGGTK